MPKKHALLIANTEYRDGKLSSLPHPGLAYAELADALKDPSRGAFSQVETLVNSNLSHVLNTLDRFFTRKPADDILLVYVGAHGFVDAQGELFLALKESDRFRLKSTALMAAVLGTNMDQCPSPHKLIILDGRFHSPYQDGRGGSAAPKVDPAKVFAGRGMPKLILSASEQPVAAPAGNPAAPSATSSTQKIQIVAPKDFTRAMAETLRTPTTLNGGRNAFTVEDWWNDAVAEMKASKAEPPTRHAVGDPPLTVLRGASLPRPELALSASSESKVMMPAMPQEPEADWSRLSGIFPLEMFAPDLAAQMPSAGARPRDEADTLPEEPPTARTLQMDTRELESRRGDETIIAGPSFIEGADLVLRAREAIENPEAGPLEGTLEIPVSDRALSEKPAPQGTDIPYVLDTPGTPADAGNGRRPDATLFYDLRLPPDLAGNATFIWDRPKEDGTKEKPTAPAANPAAPRAPAAGPRDTFTDLRARLKAQEEEEKEARLVADREEAAQREKLDQWKARWDARLSGRPMPAAGRPEGKTEAASAEAAAEKPKLSKYQSKMMALQKTVFVPGPDTDPDAETQAQPVQQEPATPPLRDGLATVVVSKDQFLNTGTHKALTELTPGATIRVSKEEFYRTDSPSTGSLEAAPGQDQGSGTLVAERPEGRGPRDGGRDRDARRTGGQPRIPRREGPGGSGPSGESGGFRKIALWVLAAMLPVGLALFLFFGYQAGLFAAFGLGGPAPRTEAPRIPKVTPPPAAEPVPAPPVEEALPGETAVAPVAAPDAPAAAEPAQTAQAAPAAAPVQTKPSSAPVSLAPAAPAPQPKPAPASPAAVLPAAPAAPAARPAVDPAARQARLQADSLRRAEEKAFREAEKSAKAAQDAERLARGKAYQDSVKAARFTRDSLAVVHDLARKDSVKAARKTRDSLAVARNLARKDSLKVARRTNDSLLTVRAQAKQDSIVQARLIRDYERAKKAEADAALHAIERARQDSLRAIQESAQSETLLRKSVNQAMRADTQELRGLYNRFALGYPGLKGEVVVNILVAPTGEIEKGTVHSSSTGVKMFDQLVLGNVMEWKIRPFKAKEAKAILVGLRFPPEGL